MKHSTNLLSRICTSQGIEYLTLEGSVPYEIYILLGIIFVQRCKYSIGFLPPGVRQIVGQSPGRVKPKTIKLVFVASPLCTQHYGVRAKTGWLGIRIMCPSGATCLPADCCFSELQHYKNQTQHVGLEQNGLIIISLNVTCSRHMI